MVSGIHPVIDGIVDVNVQDFYDTIMIEIILLFGLANKVYWRRLGRGVEEGDDDRSDGSGGDEVG